MAQKVKLVKAVSCDARHNLRQTLRLDLADDQLRYRPRRSEPFNPLKQPKKGKAKSSFTHEEVKANFHRDVHRPTKADAKVPKQGNHGFSRAEKPYTGPGKPRGPRVPGRPAVMRIEHQLPGDKMGLNKPSRPEGHAFRSWNSGSPKRKKE